ncbi:mycofactocin biosynthesis glycosyltransferase MftF [Streptomyces sp. NPDC005799]|uniref:mycofactocin biosynthesis glycosyltransferase MftF n=1 Tax=Streptomyces sp. NPDC005799 TaxID=3154678 RepID=UPI0033C90269
MTLPHGFRVVLDDRTRILDEGRALLGGHPTRLLRLSPRARTLLSGRELRVRDEAGAFLADRLLDAGLAHPSPEPGTTDVRGDGPVCTYVVPVRDRPRQLDRLLASIPSGAPVVIVDDASRSPDHIARVAARHGARLLLLPVNLGPAGARNAGLSLVTTPFVAFVDSDVVLSPTTVPTLLDCFADPRVALAAPRIAGLDTGDTTGWLGRYENARSSLDLGSRPAAVRSGTPVSWVPSACVVVRTDAFAAAAGFDARMRVGEDVDLCWRLERDGWRLRYEPTAQAAHEHRTRLTAWIRRKAFYGTGAHPIAKRHPGYAAPVVLAPWSAALLLALLAQRRWSLPAAGVVCAVTTGRIAGKLRGTDRPWRHAVRLIANGGVVTLLQGGSLITRHWWPLAAVGCLASSRLRRAAAVAAVADVVCEYRFGETGLDPLRYGIARRLDDLAYGAGVWYSAVKGRSTAALRPSMRISGRRAC